MANFRTNGGIGLPSLEDGRVFEDNESVDISRNGVNLKRRPSVNLGRNIKDGQKVRRKRKRKGSAVTGASIIHVLFPYRQSIFLFLLSYVFCVMLINDHIQNHRRMDALVVHVRGHEIAWNDTFDKEQRPPFYLDLNVLASGSSNAIANHQEMDRIVEEMSDEHEPFRRPFFETPSFLEDIQALEETLARKYKNSVGQLRSCRWNGTEYGERGRCSSMDGPAVYYNRFDLPRFVCGKRLDPGKHIKMETRCGSTPRLFSARRAGHDLDPIVLRANDAHRLRRTKQVPCDIPCAVAGSPNSAVTIWSVDGTKWKILASQEGPQKHRSLHIRPHAYQNDVFWSTTDMKSEIPWPSYSTSMSIQGLPVDYGTARRAALFWEDECETPSNREKMVEELQAAGAFPVESFGKCHHNVDIPANFDSRNKTSAMKNYLFYLAFEDQVENDHVSEKLWEALAAGSIPVYFGADNIRDHIPPNSVILVSEFDDMAELAGFLNKVSADRALYSSFHSWRSRALPDWFRKKYEFTEASATCRTCRWARARMYGQSWDHQSQTTKPIARAACIDGGGMVTTPVAESWDLVDEGPQQVFLKNSVAITSNCKLANVVASIGDFDTERTVDAQDGVLDLTLGDSVHSGLRWKFRLPLDTNSTKLRNVEKGVAWAQDRTTRVSFLTWPKQVLAFSEAGTVEVPVVPNLKLRIVTEQLDTFHTDGEEVENYFGRKSREDLWNPVEEFSFTQ